MTAAAVELHHITGSVLGCVKYYTPLVLSAFFLDPFKLFDIQQLIAELAEGSEYHQY